MHLAVREMRLRLLIGVAVVSITAALIVVEGLSVTSGVIEVVTFTGGLVAWVAVGRRDEKSDDSPNVSVSNVRSKGVTRVLQRGKSLSVRCIAAKEGVEIRQEEPPSGEDAE